MENTVNKPVTMHIFATEGFGEVAKMCIVTSKQKEK